MSTDRMRRVNEAVREVLSDAIKLLKDPRVGFVTVTDVRTSPDLRHAKVFVSVFGTDEERTATMDGLASAHGVLQTAVNRELRLKRTPTLDFVYDDTAALSAIRRSIAAPRALSESGRNSARLFPVTRGGNLPPRPAEGTSAGPHPTPASSVAD